MKALEIPQEAQHLVLLEKGDRFVQLVGEETAVIIGESDDKEVKVTVHFPELEEGQEVPMSVMMSAAVREFLHDPDLVKLVQERIRVKSQEILDSEQGNS